MTFTAMPTTDGGRADQPGSGAGFRSMGFRQNRGRSLATCLVLGMVVLGGCDPPPEVIDLQTAPQATRDAMLRVKILPLGTPAPADAGAIGPVTGLGCGQVSVDAATQAVEQLRVKAMRMHATAVMDVIIGPADFGSCMGHAGATANGIAIGPRGIPSSY
jgi:hypothetical protein